MEDDGFFAKALAVFASGIVLLACLAMVVTRLPFSHTVRLVAGQSLVLVFPHPVRLHVDADVPVTVRGSFCQNPGAVDADISCGAGSVVITDVRPPLLVWGKANRVRWSAPIF